MQNSLQLGKKNKWMAELGGYFYSSTIWQGLFKSHAFGGLDVGVQKKIFNSAGNIKILFSEIFFSEIWKGESNFGGQKLFLQGILRRNY